MREIKFRGKSSKDDLYFKKDEWVYGSLQIFKGFSIFDSSLKNWFTVYGKTVGQYTGLHDKNGVEIYESDIVRQTFEVCYPETEQEDGYSFYGNDVGEVIILPSKGVCIKNIIRNAIENEEDEIVNKRLKYYKNLTASRCEVIGNIYENPELIEVRK